MINVVQHSIVNLTHMKFVMILYFVCVHTYYHCLILMDDTKILANNKNLFLAWKISKLVFTTKRFDYYQIYMDNYKNIHNIKRLKTTTYFNVTHKIISERLQYLYTNEAYNIVLNPCFLTPIKVFMDVYNPLLLEERERIIMDKLEKKVNYNDKRYAEFFIKATLKNYIDVIIENSIKYEINLDAFIQLYDFSASGFYYKNIKPKVYEYFEMINFDRRDTVKINELEHFEIDYRYKDCTSLFLNSDILDMFFIPFLKYLQPKLYNYSIYHESKRVEDTLYEREFACYVKKYDDFLDEYIFDKFNCHRENRKKMLQYKNIIGKKCDYIYRQSDAQLKVLLSTTLYYYIGDYEELLDFCVEYITKRVDKFYDDMSLVLGLTGHDRQIMIYLF